MSYEREGGASTKKILLIVFGILGGVLLLIVLACAGLIYWGYNTFAPAMAGVQKSAEAFVQDIHAGRLQAAYDQASTAFRTTTSMQQFEDVVARFPAIRNYTSLTMGGIHVNATPAGTQGLVSYTAAGPHDSVSFRLVVVQEQGRWRVNSLQIP